MMKAYKNRLKLCDLWFRLGFYKFAHYHGIYLKRPSTWPLRLEIFLSAFVYRASWGMIGRVDGWMGIFKKSNEI